MGPVGARQPRRMVELLTPYGAARYIQFGQRLYHRIQAHQPRSGVQRGRRIRVAQCVQTGGDARILHSFHVVGQLLQLGIAPGLLCSERQVAVQAQCHGLALNVLRVLVLERGAASGTPSLQAVCELLVAGLCAAFAQRRCQVRDDGSVAAALGDHGLADVAHGVQVQMRHLAYQGVGPVVVGQRDLLAGRELQAAVGAEVHHRIRTEDLARPQVRGHIGPRWRELSAVHDLEGVVTHTGQRLRQQYHIAQRHARYGDAALIAGSIA